MREKEGDKGRWGWLQNRDQSCPWWDLAPGSFPVQIVSLLVIINIVTNGAINFTTSMH